MSAKYEISDKKTKEGVLNLGFSPLDENLYNVERSRPVLTAKYLESNYQYNDLDSQNVFKSSVNYVKKYYKPSKSCCTRFLYKRIPFINWIMNYDIKEALLKDLIGGITVRKLIFLLLIHK